MIQAMDRRSAACCRRSMRRPRRATRSSSSPATTAASGSPILGRSPAEDRAARRRTAHSGDHRWPARIPRARHRSGGDHNGLAADAAGGGGGEPDPAYPSDGIDLLPVLTQASAPVPRKLFWRYKANAQRAVRDGDYEIPEDSRTTRSCSTSRRIRWSAPTSRSGRRTSTTGWRRSGTNGTRRCCRGRRERQRRLYR